MIESNGIQIYYSARIERLVAVLNKDIGSFYDHLPNPLQPINIVVPNGHIQKYLNRRLTEINGIIANLNFPFLESGFYDALNQVQSIQNPALLNKAQDIELAIWGILSETKHSKNPKLSPLFDYLLSQPNSALISQKRWQLSQQLALLFIDYELTRPEIIDAWLADRLFFKDSQNQRLQDIETAQMFVYRILVEQPHMGHSLHGLIRNFKVTSAPPLQPVFLFVPSRLSPLHRQIILLLARYYPVYIYHFNVCREFWLDLETDAEMMWRQSVRQLKLSVTDANGHKIEADKTHAGGELTGEQFFDLDAGLADLENPLLKAWGKPGRETLRLLSELESDANYYGIPYQDTLLDEQSDDFEVPKCTLGAMQQGILNRIPADESLSDLKSTVQLASAPSIEVEVTQVYHSILYELKQDRSLQLTDIAVLVTDMATYRYVIEQVFERLNRHVNSPLHYSISDSNAGEESLYARAVRQLLTVLETDFIREEVFALLTNPCVMTALDSHPDEVDAWFQTAVDLGIFRGFNQLYESTDEDTRGLFTWQQGLRRLHRALAQSQADNSTLNRHEIGRFSVLMSALYESKKMLNQTRTGRQWQQCLQDLVDTFIHTPPDYPQEQSVALTVNRDLQQLADQHPDLMFSDDDIKQYLTDRLSNLDAGRGRYLSGGVVCAALQPMRPVPFKITYVLGLGESQFPGQIRHNTLDLAAYSRRIGDINQVENNKYLFLETVMSTRDKLFLSYVGRDSKTGDTLLPSVVVNDVIEWFEQQNTESLPRLDLPLTPVDIFKLQARHEHRSLLQNHLFSDYLLYRLQTTDSDTFSVDDLVDLSPRQHRKLEQMTVLEEVQGVDHANHEKMSTEPSLTLEISELGDYLIKPTETLFVQQGGVLTRIEDRDLISHEPLSINPLDKHQILNRAVEADLKLSPDSNPPHADLATLLDHEYQQFLRQSRVPISMFASIEPLKQINQFEEYQSLKQCIESNMFTPLHGNLMIGSVYSRQTAAQHSGPVTLTEINQQALTLSACIAHLLVNKQQQLAAQIIIRAGRHGKIKSLELLSRAFLDWCLLLLHEDLVVAENYQVHLIFQNKIQTHTFDASLIDPAIVRHYLTALCRDYINGDNAYLPLSLYRDLSFKFSRNDTDRPDKIFPFKDPIYFAYQNLPVFLLDRLKENYQRALTQAAEVAKSFAGNQSPAHNEVKCLLSYPPSEDVLRDYRQRFGLFFAVLNHIDAGDFYV